jgi:hypothetical protein
VRVPEAVGLVVCCLVRFPEHAPDGNLTHLRDSLIERWAGWEGERGKFAQALRDTFLTDGVWVSWEKHNGAALREAGASRQRAAEHRKIRAQSLLDSAAQGTPNGTANGTANGTPDHSPLRTNERTNLTTGGRKRPWNGNSNGNGSAPSYAPGHDNLPPQKDCECPMGQGDGSRRLTKLHTEGCPNA